MNPKIKLKSYLKMTILSLFSVIPFIFHKIMIYPIVCLKIDKNFVHVN